MIYAAPPVDQKQKAQDGPHGAKPDWVALALFYGLILNPEWGRLGGPCARCHKYYIMKTIRQQKYCSRMCGSWATAKASTRKRLDMEHAHKLARAQAAAQLWLTARTERDWKQWVSRKEASITSKWLTRA